MDFFTCGICLFSRSVIGNCEVLTLPQDTGVAICVFRCDHKGTAYVRQCIGHDIVDIKRISVCQHQLRFVDRDPIVGSISVKVIGQLLSKQVGNGNRCVIIIHLYRGITIHHIVKLRQVVELITQRTVVLNQGKILGFVDKGEGHILILCPALTKSLCCARTVIILEPVFFAASPVARFRGALTPAEKIERTGRGYAIGCPCNIPGKHILICSVLDLGDLNDRSVIVSCNCCQVYIVVYLSQCCTGFIQQLHLIHDEPSVLRTLALRPAGYGHLEFPKESATCRIRYEGAFLCDLRIYFTMAEFIPAPRGLPIYRDLVFIGKGAGHIERGRRRCISNQILPTVIAQLQLAAVDTVGGLRNFIGPAGFIPN